MKKGKDYERAKLELIHLDPSDVIATSNISTGGPLGGTPGKSETWDNSGWT